MLDLEESGFSFYRLLSGVDAVHDPGEPRFEIADGGTILPRTADRPRLNEFQLPVKTSNTINFGTVDDWVFRVSDGLFVARRSV